MGRKQHANPGLSESLVADPHAPGDPRLQAASADLPSELDHLIEHVLADGPVAFGENRFRDGSKVAVFVSPNFERLFGHRHDIDSSMSDWFMKHVHPDDRTKARDEAQAAIAAGSPSGGVQVRFLHGNGEYRWMQTHTRFTYRDDGTLLRMRWFMVDVTEQVTAEQIRSKAQDQLRQAARVDSLALLAAGAAHDFNNLTAVVLANAELVRAALPTDLALSAELERRCEAIRRYLSEIEDASAHAFQLTQQLLSFGRSDQSEPHMVALGSILANLDGLLKRMLGESVELQVRSTLGDHFILAQRGEIEQVVINLLSNAREAMPRGGRVVITVQSRELDEAWCESHPGLSPGRFVSLAVEDDGTGMSPQTKERAFDPFFTTKPARRGTGLGLATVHGIVRRAGGVLEIFSELGLGSTVTAYFPLVQAVEEPTTTVRRSSPPEGDGSTAIVVTDHRTLLDAVCEILAGHGYAVLPAVDATECLALCTDKASRVDVLLTDMLMPGLSGMDLAGRFQAMRPTVPVVFMTSVPIDSLPEQIRLRVTDRLLSKPFSSDRLLRVVGDAISNAREASE